ncbi:hypothetical protein BU17DRAFT_65911 [Hysterangium stoloniferum]|nr:hypothetical protein BU17DRAFT_65911 [Hysterangium stoloniferum]
MSALSENTSHHVNTVLDISQPSHSHIDNLAKHQRNTVAQRNANKQKAMWHDIKAEWERQEDAAVTLAQKHGQKVEWMHIRLQRLPEYGKTCKINTWNAFIHVRSMDLNQEGSDLPVGEKLRLTELVKLANSTNEYESLPKDKIDAMMACLQEARQRDATGSRSQPKAIRQDVHQTSKHVHKELMTLGSHCRTSSMAITVQTSGEGSSPLYYMDPAARQFVEIVLGMDVDTFCLKFESFAILGLQKFVKNDNDRRSLQKSQIRSTVRDRLCKITGEDGLNMEWTAYEDLIIDKYHVILDGWPKDIVFNPADLGTKSLAVVIAALEDGTCNWKKLTEESYIKYVQECERKIQAGEVHIPKRKRHSDAGQKRGPYKRQRGEARCVSDVRPEEESDDDGKLVVSGQ